MPCDEKCDCHKKNNLTNFKKWVYTLYTAIIALLLFNRYSYLFVNSLIGNVCDKNGCPTFSGFLLHIFVFIIILRLLM